jgi:REP element-mobilizing transposase RayT
MCHAILISVLSPNAPQRDKAMILGFHVIFSTYGFWLPNDPRGSWSEFVGNWQLLRFGTATKVDTRRSVAASPHDHGLRRRAKTALAYPPVHLTGCQALAAAMGFDQARRESGYTIYACSVLPEHVHMVVGAHHRKIRFIVGHFKGRATQHLIADGLWPEYDRPIWGRKSWAVFLDAPDDIRRAIAYVAQNPEKERKPRQRWSFVSEYL